MCPNCGNASKILAVDVSLEETKEFGLAAAMMNKLKRVAVMVPALVTD